jgi:hypothetical protein
MQSKGANSPDTKQSDEFIGFQINTQKWIGQIYPRLNQRPNSADAKSTDGRIQPSANLPDAKPSDEFIGWCVLGRIRPRLNLLL